MLPDDRLKLPESIFIEAAGDMLIPAEAAMEIYRTEFDDTGEGAPIGRSEFIHGYPSLVRLVVVYLSETKSFP